MQTLPWDFGADDATLWTNWAHGAYRDLDPEPADARLVVARHAAEAWRTARSLVDRARGMMDRSDAYKRYTAAPGPGAAFDDVREFEGWVDAAVSVEDAAAEALCWVIMRWCGRARYEWELKNLGPDWAPCVLDLDGTIYVVAPTSEDNPAPRLMTTEARSLVSGQDGM